MQGGGRDTTRSDAIACFCGGRCPAELKSLLANPPAELRTTAAVYFGARDANYKAHAYVCDEAVGAGPSLRQMAGHAVAEEAAPGKLIHEFRTRALEKAGMRPGEFDMLDFTVKLAPEILQAVPSFARGVITVFNANNSGIDQSIDAVLQSACGARRSDPVDLGDVRVTDWDAAYRAFRLNPNRHPPAHKALLKRVQHGSESLPFVNNLVAGLVLRRSPEHVWAADGRAIRARLPLDSIQSREVLRKSSRSCSCWSTNQPAPTRLKGRSANRSTASELCARTNR